MPYCDNQIGLGVLPCFGPSLESDEAFGEGEMIVECNRCESKVNAETIGYHDEVDREMMETYRISLAKCPICGIALLVGQEEYQTGPDEYRYSPARRLWREPDNRIHGSIPSEARSSLEEAQRCYKARAFSACAVMCGKAVEAICVQHTRENTLFKGLEALQKKGVIDGRLLEWGESLRHERNLGAHATGTKTTRDDARDILEFAVAICEYVYVLSEKYTEYKSRKAKVKPAQ